MPMSSDPDITSIGRRPANATAGGGAAAALLYAHGPGGDDDDDDDPKLLIHNTTNHRSGMGCMAGILQIFDVHRILSGPGRRTRRFLGHIRRNIHIINMAASAGVSSSKFNGHKCNVKNHITSPNPDPPPPNDAKNGDHAERIAMDDDHHNQHNSDTINISANYIASSVTSNCSGAIHSSNKFHEYIIEALSDPPAPSPIIMSRSNSANLNISNSDQLLSIDPKPKCSLIHIRPSELVEFELPSSSSSSAIANSRKSSYEPSSYYSSATVSHCNDSPLRHLCSVGRNDLKEMHRLSLDGSCRGSARYNNASYINTLSVATINGSSPLAAQRMHSFLHNNNNNHNDNNSKKFHASSGSRSITAKSSAYGNIMDHNWDDNDGDHHGSSTINNHEPKRSSFSSNVVAKLMGLDDDDHDDDGDVLVSSTSLNNPNNHGKTPLLNQLIHKNHHHHHHYHQYNSADYVLSSAANVHLPPEEEEEARRNDSTNNTWFQRQFLVKKNTMEERCDDLEALKQLLCTMEMGHIRRTTNITNSMATGNRSVLQCSPEYNRVSRNSREGSSSNNTTPLPNSSSSSSRKSSSRTSSRSKKGDHGNAHMPSQIYSDDAYRSGIQSSQQTPTRSRRRPAGTPWQSGGSCTESCSEEAASESSVCEAKESAASIDGPNQPINTSTQSSWHDGRAPTSSRNNLRMRANAGTGEPEKMRMRLCHERVVAHTKKKKMMMEGTSLIVNRDKCMKAREIPRNVASSCTATNSSTGRLGISNASGLNISDRVRPNSRLAFRPNSEGIRPGVQRSTSTRSSSHGPTRPGYSYPRSSVAQCNLKFKGSSSSSPCCREDIEKLHIAGKTPNDYSSSTHDCEDQSNDNHNNKLSELLDHVEANQIALATQFQCDKNNLINHTSIFCEPHRSATNPYQQYASQSGASKWLESKESDETDSQGDKSTTGLYCEQPSPISVLDGPFYHEESSEISSPPLAKASTKLMLRFEEEMQCGDAKTSEEEEEEGVELVEAECVSQLGIQDPLEFPSSMDTIDNDFEYVKELLRRTITLVGASDIGLNEKEALHEGTNMMMINNTYKLAPLQSQLFAMLEAENNNNMASSSLSLSSIKSTEPGSSDLCMYQRRKLLFDLVDSRLRSRVNKWLVLQHHPWILAREHNINKRLLGCSHVLNPFFIQGLDEHNNVCLSKVGANVLMKEVWEETVSSTNKTAKGHCILNENEGSDGKLSRDGIDDHVGRLIEADILRDSRAAAPSGGDWCHIEGLDAEKAKISRDIERLIFKDLIDHILRDLGLMSSLSFSSSFTKRQLFH